MNISAMLLAPSMESVCKKSFDEVCTMLNMGLAPKEISEYLQNISANKGIQVDAAAHRD